MKFVCFILIVVAAILMKENSCVPSIRPLSQRSIIFPEDNWDNCFLDISSTWPGICKRLYECPEVLKKWDIQNIYPKTCYFIKDQQFVCCPLPPPVEHFTSSTQKIHNIFLTTPTAVTTKKPGNIFLNKNTQNIRSTTEVLPTAVTTKKPANIFLDKNTQNIQSTTEVLPDSLLAIFQNWDTSTSSRPPNIFLNNLNPVKSTSPKPPSTAMPEKASFYKRRSEIECALQNRNKFETIDTIAPSFEINEFPFMAVIGLKSGQDNKFWYACGGVLISARFILTTAHCAELGSPAVVHLGDNSLNGTQEGTIKIKQFITHPDYERSTIYNDIAVVELEQEVDNPLACLWSAHDLPITKLTALGFGQASFETLSPHQLFKASLTVIDKAECQNYYNNNQEFEITDIVDTNLCAGGVENARSSCQGDTGGPLMMKLDGIFYVVGLTSFGLGCDDLPPTISARVSSFIDWIEPIIWADIDIRVEAK